MSFPSKQQIEVVSLLSKYKLREVTLQASNKYFIWVDLELRRHFDIGLSPRTELWFYTRITKNLGDLIPSLS